MFRQALAGFDPKRRSDQTDPAISLTIPATSASKTDCLYRALAKLRFVVGQLRFYFATYVEYVAKGTDAMSGATKAWAAGLGSNPLDLIGRDSWGMEPASS